MNIIEKIIKFFKTKVKKTGVIKSIHQFGDKGFFFIDGQQFYVHKGWNEYPILAGRVATVIGKDFITKTGIPTIEVEKME